MASRPRRSGRSTVICRSNRPGRSRAGSSTSGRLVAASTTTAWLDSKPSIATNNCSSVCSRSSLLANADAPLRVRPIASISSRKMMHGAFFLACSKRSRTRLAPSPTKSSTKSVPLALKKGTLARSCRGRRGTSEQGFASPWWADQQHAFGNMGSNGEVALRFAQEVDFLAQVGLGFVDPGYVGEGGGGTLFVVEFRTAAPQAKEATGLLRLPYAAQGHIAKVDQQQEG